MLIYEPMFRAVRPPASDCASTVCHSSSGRQRSTSVTTLIFGTIDIANGYVCENPRVVIRDRVELGLNILFVVNRLVEIESDVNVAGGARFLDSDGIRPSWRCGSRICRPWEDEVKAVRCRAAWIGQNACILKGVTVGEGVIVGINSAVVTDVPPPALMIGNPVRVVVRNTPRTPS